jgi:phage-related protein
MKLFQVGRDKWTVLVVADDGWRSPLLSLLLERTENQIGERMLALLREHVPSYGPPRNEDVSKPLGDGRFEFRKQPRRGPALRVLYFYDANCVVVCASAFRKKSDSTPGSEIDRLEHARARYVRAKKSGNLEIRTWTPPEELR